MLSAIKQGPFVRWLALGRTQSWGSVILSMCLVAAAASWSAVSS